MKTKYSHTYKSQEIHDFVSLFNEDETIGIIRDILLALKSQKKGEDEFWLDADVRAGIDYPNFFIEDFKLPLIEMKNILF
ncbi:MAG: hypothetical protein ACPGVD_12700, partial [Flavobacteriales bacterium]